MALSFGSRLREAVRPYVKSDTREWGKPATNNLESLIDALRDGGFLKEDPK